MDDQRSLEAQLLGDMTYDDPRKHAQAGGTDPRLAGASAPLLDDMGGSAAQKQPQSRYQRLTDAQIATLQQQRAAQGQPAYTPEEIEVLQAEFVERQRLQEQQQAMAAQAAAQQSAAAARLAEDTYVEKEKPKHEELRQVDAGALLEDAPPEPERKIVFNQEDLEAAKKEAVKSAASKLDTGGPQSEDEQKRARQQMQALRQQQLADLAEAGFPVSIVMTVIGVIVGILTAFASFQALPEDFADNGFFHFCNTVLLIDGILLAALAVTIVLRVQKLKGLTSFLFGASALFLLVYGLVRLASGGFSSAVGMTTSEKLKAYYEHKDYMFD